MFVCRSQATCLLYHMFVSLSTIIFVFFKTFQIVYLEETIPCDSLVRIPELARKVNPLLLLLFIFFSCFPDSPSFSCLISTQTDETPSIISYTYC